ncbi:unnamed protein product [Haemonchus placei]|uniref:Ovule protein n=1 Tax=Haemonchus placei TaxID=6290 RepID=A0A0N4WSJ5_HAEPC|nr:unnamed protein product [Haemonchus placei]
MEKVKQSTSMAKTLNTSNKQFGAPREPHIIAESENEICNHSPSFNYYRYPWRVEEDIQEGVADISGPMAAKLDDARWKE